MPKLGSCSEVCVIVGYNVPLTAIWLKAQVGLKVLHELRSRVIDLIEWKTVSFVLRIPSLQPWLLVFTPYNILHWLGYNGLTVYTFPRG